MILNLVETEEYKASMKKLARLHDTGLLDNSTMALIIAMAVICDLYFQENMIALATKQ